MPVRRLTYVNASGKSYLGRGHQDCCPGRKRWTEHDEDGTDTAGGHSHADRQLGLPDTAISSGTHFGGGTIPATGPSEEPARNAAQGMSPERLRLVDLLA